MSARGGKGFLLNVLLGGFAVLGHAPFYIWPVTILCLALLMIRLDGATTLERPKKAAFWTGLAFGLGYFLFGLYWIGSAFVARGGAFVPIMPFAVLLLCAGLAVFWGLAGLAYIRVVRAAPHSALRAIVFVCVFWLAEFTRGHLFGGFPWNLPGYVFPAGKPISQAAVYIGIYGLSALVLFLAGALALALSSKPRKIIPSLVGVVVLGGLYTMGAMRLGGAKIEYVEGVKLRIVHANISQKDKFIAEKYSSTVFHYLNLSMSAGFEDVTHIIWPEGAVPGLMFEDPGLMAEVDRAFRSGPGQPPVWIAQTLRQERTAGGQGSKLYNAAAAVTFSDSAGPQFTPYYDKRKLVPFGEFMPGGAFVEKLGLRTLSTAMEGMSPGKRDNVPALPNLPPASLQICYEIIFTGFTPKTLQPSGAAPQWILNLSNDSWYGNSTGPRQHVNQVRYRAIEEGLPVVRSTSGGISGVIDPYGRQLNQLNVKEDGIIDAALPRPVQKIAYTSMATYQWFIAIILLLLLCTVRLQRAR